MAVLWSAEAMHAVRIHNASFEAICPDSAEAFDAWWSGEPTSVGRRSMLIVFDPVAGRRADRARWIGTSQIATAQPRYRDYADAADRLRRAGLV